MPTIFDLEKQMRSRLDAKDAATLEQIALAYNEVYRNIQAEIEALLYKLETGNYTRSTVTKLAQYNRLIGEIEKELTKYGGYLETTIRGASREMIGWGLDDSRQKVEMILAEHGIKLDTDFRTMNPDSIEKLISWLDKESPLFKRIQTLPEFTAQGVANEILAGVAKGDNPRTIAKGIENALGGGLTDALRMTRTVQIYSYREASRANYIANSDIVTGWIWWAELDSETCAACIANHGQEFPLDQPLDDHYNGRCTALPMVLGFNPVQDQQKGEDWFKEQPEDVQRDILGAGKYEAWSEGKFELSDMVGSRQDDVYGEMVSVATLEELTNKPEIVNLQSDREIIVNEIAEQFDFPRDKINLIDKSGEVIFYGDRAFITRGDYDEATREINIYGNVPNEEIKDILSHEIEHDKYVYMRNAGKKNEQWANDLYYDIFNYEKQAHLRETGEITPYAKLHWGEAKKSWNGYEHAVKETLSEMASLDARGELEKSKIDNAWTSIYQRINDGYKNRSG